MLDPNQCRVRHKRLLDAMQQQRLDAIALGATHHVYYFTSHLASVNHHAGFILFADGRSWLTTANAPPRREVAADQVEPYEANWFGTLRQDQPAAVAELICAQLKSGRVGIDASAVSSQLAMRLDARSIAIDPLLFQLRVPRTPMSWS